MKKNIMITVLVVCVLAITTLISSLVFGQTNKKEGKSQKPIPANVMKIAEKSCVKCHTEPGNGMALMHLNLSNWDKYSAEKQAAKANDICKMVTKEKMPPKKMRAEHPESIPSKDEIKTLCDWAQSLQVPKK